MLLDFFPKFSKSRPMAMVNEKIMELFLIVIIWQIQVTFDQVMTKKLTFNFF